MATAEQLGLSIRTEGRGVHVLVWDDQEDLIHALLVLEAVLDDLARRAFFVSANEEELAGLRKLMETRRTSDDSDAEGAPCKDELDRSLWILFIQQAASKQVAPSLNGARRPMADPPGTLLVVRNADFEVLQRHAPDLASFVGPRIYDASTSLSIWSAKTHKRLRSTLSPEIAAIIQNLPGTAPSKQSLAVWKASNAPQ